MSNMKKPKGKSPDEMDALGKSLGYFKLNLPESFEAFQRNNGEGIWAVVDDMMLKERLDSDEEIDMFVAYAANNSISYPDISFGKPVLAMQRGQGFRPIAVWEFLTDSDKAREAKKVMLQELQERGELGANKFEDECWELDAINPRHMDEY